MKNEVTLKYKDDSSDEDMKKILRATNHLNIWRIRMKKEYEAEDWHLNAALDAFCSVIGAVTMETDEED